MTLRFCWSCVSVLMLPVFRIRNIFQHWGQLKLSLLTLFVRRDTPLKKIAIVVAVSALAVLMVLPVMGVVNLSAGKPVTIDRALSADGWPIPPFPPTAISNADPTTVADR